MNDKELLLKDLCARLPYNVKYHYIDIQNNDRIDTLKTIVLHRDKTELIFMVCGDFSVQHTQDDPLVKPYLLPLSSMNEEQKREYSILCYEEERDCYECGELVTRVYLHNTIESIDWLNKNHFDYRGLIPRGLAIDCTNLNIY